MTNLLYYIVFPFLLFSLCLRKVLFLLADSKSPDFPHLSHHGARRALHLNLSLVRSTAPKVISLQGALATRISITVLMWTLALIMHNN